MKEGGQRAGEPADGAEHRGAQQQTQEHHGEVHAAERQGDAPDRGTGSDPAGGEPPGRARQPAKDHQLSDKKNGVWEHAAVPRVERRQQAIEDQRGGLCRDPEGEQAGEKPQRPRAGALAHRRSLKNACINARHSSSHTPPTTSNRWLSPGNSRPRTAETSAPVFGSAAPYTTSRTRA